MKVVYWRCDCENCNKQAEGYVIPQGWLEASFYDKRYQKFRRYCFCGYTHLAEWAEARKNHSQKEVEHAQEPRGF